MATVIFSTGQKVRFNGTPTQRDIEEVAQRLGIKPGQGAQGGMSAAPMSPLGNFSNIAGNAANTINNAYEGYKNLPIVKQAGQLVGGVVGAAGGLIGGVVGGVGETGIQTVKALGGKGFDVGKIGSSIVDTAKSTAGFGYNIGKEGTAAAPLGAAGRAVNLALAYGQGYQGIKDVAGGLKSGDAAQTLQGALSLGTAGLGVHGAIKNGGIVLDPAFKAGLQEKIGFKPKIVPEGPGGSMITMPQQKAITKAADIYRQVLNEGKGEAKKVQNTLLRTGQTRDVPKLLAAEGLQINATPEGKLDTTTARSDIAQRMDATENALNSVLSSDNKKWFDLERFRSDAKKRIDAIPNVLANEKNGMKSYLDTIVNDQIAADGKTLTGQQANQFKRGLYKVGYPNGMAPANVSEVRGAASIVMDAIEKHYPDRPIKPINRVLGDYLIMDKTLENVHGRAIRGGLLMKGLKQTTGSIVGSVIGSPLGPIGSGAGAMIAHSLVGKGVDALLSPSRLTTKAGKITQRVGIKPRFSMLGELKVGPK